MVIDNQQKRELVLSMGSYAFLQDITKGNIRVFTGPTSFTPTSQDVPIVYRDNKFMRVDSFEAAVCKSPVAVEGYYIVLLNPAVGDKHPEPGSSTSSPELVVGRKVIIPGPAMFSLWPGQCAEVIRGHQLKYNQYLLARVYNEDEARKNVGSAVVKGAEGAEGATPGETKSFSLPTNFSVGTQFIVRGDQVSFFIPPTGISIVRAENGQYIRDALTLERLEYCILIDENGSKRIEKGPQVVFPKPSEKFKESLNEDGELTRKFRAIELNENQGIHLKVIASYTEGATVFKEGEELFLTGKESAIYYPREEHSVIKVEDKVKHWATAVPVGEGRYVMNRNTGEIRMVRGPAMLLPDPRTEVLIRRVLSQKQADMWYPGNVEVARYNNELRLMREAISASSSGTSAVLSEDRFRSPVGAVGPTSDDLVGMYSHSADSYSLTGGSLESMGASTKGLMSKAARSMVSNSRVEKEQSVQGDQFHRSNNYTPARSITLDTKFQGAPGIEIWTGYACQIVSKSGKRRVEKGPTAVLLEYDESLEILELSTGKPKTTDRTIKIAYLRVDNNQVSDQVVVDTSDHVAVQLNLSFKVDFEGDSSKWFQVENYVKFLCDHVRSILKGRIRKMPIKDFYENATDHIRNFVLGESSESGTRPGLFFKENNMRVRDVEVLRVYLPDDKIRMLLDQAQHDAVQSNITLERTRRHLDFTKQNEAITRERLHTEAETAKIQHEINMDLANAAMAVTLQKFANSLKEFDAKQAEEQARQSIQQLQFDATMERKEAEAAFASRVNDADQARRLAFITAETDSVMKRLGVLLPGFSEALLALSRDEVVAKVASALNIQQIIGGKSVADSINQAFAGTALAESVKSVLQKVPTLPVVPNGNGAPSVKPPGLS